MNNSLEKYEQFVKNVLNRYTFVDDKSVSLFFSIAKIQHFKKGEIILPLGKISKHIYILYSGAVVSCYLYKDGNVYHKNIFLQGDFAGSVVSSLTNKPSQFSLEAIEDTVIISFPFKEYKQLIKEHRDIQNFYVAYIEKNWIIDKEQREIDIVMKEAKERYLDYINTNPEIENRIPLHYIASHLGITPTQLSRIRKNIKNTTL
ncbi:Crp/Fnr family transcriptional regulator [Tenacibaculum sp.]|uniref:Crp/Fnr family transcriptional regulator n=1 Tax=Tenacibaculum sp. TaxID=1906242 RepID=UPI003D0EBE04